MTNEHTQTYINVFTNTLQMYIYHPKHPSMHPPILSTMCTRHNEWGSIEKEKGEREREKERKKEGERERDNVLSENCKTQCLVSSCWFLNRRANFVL